MASGLFNSARQKFIQGDIDWDANDVECLLVKNTYTFDETDEFVTDLVAHECSASGYVRQNVTTRTASDATTTVIDCDDVDFGVLGSGESLSGAVFFVNSGADATSSLICFIDVTDFATGLDTELIIPATGLFTWAG
jgi:hypothetical protein